MYLKDHIVGRMWKRLRELFHTVEVRVLHPRIPQSSSVDILRGVPQGSRLSPTLFGIFGSLEPDVSVRNILWYKPWYQKTTNWYTSVPQKPILRCGAQKYPTQKIVYVDDLCLISTDARELQMMINTCQTWSAEALMQLSADKTKIMCFHTSTKCAKTTTQS